MTIAKERYIRLGLMKLDEELKNNRDKSDKIEVKMNDLTIETMSFESVYETVNNFKLNWKYLDFARPESNTLVFNIQDSG